MFGSIVAGMAVMAKSGAPLAKLATVIDTAMAVWPANVKARSKAA
jgi:hypothetical protein